jgi:hypothetical protein
MQHPDNVEMEIIETVPAKPETRDESAVSRDGAARGNQSTPQPYSALND